MSFKLKSDGKWYQTAAGIWVQSEPISKALVAAASVGDAVTVAADGSLELTTPSGGGGGVTLLTLTNGGAESASTTGWTQVGGGFTSELANPSGHVVTPVEGTRCFVATANADVSQYQDISLSSYATAIATGAVLAGFQAATAPTFTTPEQHLLQLTALDGSNASLGMAQVTIPAVGGTAGVWYRMVATLLLPTGTAAIRCAMRAFRLNGTANNVAFDDAKAFLIGA